MIAPDAQITVAGKSMPRAKWLERYLAPSNYDQQGVQGLGPEGYIVRVRQTLWKEQRLTVLRSSFPFNPDPKRIIMDCCLNFWLTTFTLRDGKIVSIEETENLDEFWYDKRLTGDE